jgi:predicted dehydrogenase
VPSNKLRFGIIGTGSRGIRSYGRAIGEVYGDEAEIVAVSDSDPVRLSVGAEHLEVEHADTNPGMVLDNPDVDVVIITTPDATHADFACAALGADKHVLCEKPIATTIADCNRIRMAAQASRGEFMTGFVLRYVPFYEEMHAAIEQGEIGPSRFVTVADNRDGAAYFRRWHRLRANSGGLLVHKSTHALDIVNWMLNARPISVSATGGVAVFTPKEWAGERCLTCDATDFCPEYVDIREGHLKTLYHDAEATSGYIFDTCVFNSEKDTVDHATASIEYENGARASYSLCLFASYTEREIGVWGDDGKVEGRDGAGYYRISGRRDDRDELRQVEVRAGGHGGGDVRLLADALPVFRGEQEPVAGLEAAYWSTVLGIAAETSVARDGARIMLAELGAPLS